MNDTSKNINDSLTCSVIIRTKDRPRHLYQALESVGNQQRPADEIIVVNDGGGSIDQVLGAFKSLPIQLIVNEISLGRARAGNIGVEAAKGDAVAFLDDDDQFLADHLARLTLAMGRFDARVAYAGSRMIRKDLLGDAAEAFMREHGVGEFNDPFDPDRLAFENYIPLNTLLIDRELFLTVGGFDPDFNLFEDWDLLIRLSRKTRFYHVDRVTSVYGIWGESQQITLVSKTDAWQKAYAQLFSKHFLTRTDADKIEKMADYWILSQQRRSRIQSLTENEREKDQERQALIENLHHEKAQLQILSQKNAALAERMQQQEDLIRTLNREMEAQETRHRKQCGKQMPALKSALKRLGDRNRALQSAFFEQSRQMALGMTTQGVAAIAQRRNGIETTDTLKTNYGRLAQWGIDHLTRVNEERKRWAENLKEFREAIGESVGALVNETASLLDQLHHSRLKPFWPGIPIPQVTSLLEKSREILQRMDPSFQDMEAENGKILLPPTPTDGQILDSVVPVFEIFVGDETCAQLMAGARPKGSAPIPLTRGVSLFFSVRCSRDGWSRLDLMMATYMRINTCELHLAIYHDTAKIGVDNGTGVDKGTGVPSRIGVSNGTDNGGSHRMGNGNDNDRDAPLRVCRFNALAVMDNQFHAITFPPIPDSKDEVYRVVLSAPAATLDNAVAVWCHPLGNERLSLDVKSVDPLLSMGGKSEGESESIGVPMPFKGIFSRIDLSGAFHSDVMRASHIFWIYLPPSGDLTGTLPAVLFQLAQIVKSGHVRPCYTTGDEHSGSLKNGDVYTRDDTDAAVVLYGFRNGVAAAYCEKNGIEYRAMERRDAVKDKRLPWVLKQAAQSGSKATHWFFDAGMIPGSDALVNAELLFDTYPDTVMSLPLVTSCQETILHAFGQTTREGEVLTFPAGWAAGHPVYGYVRRVDGADAPFFILRSTCFNSLEKIDSLIESIQKYKTLRYQMTDFIWQLREDGGVIRFDPSVAFMAIHGKKERLDDEGLVQEDRHTFLERWQEKLYGHPSIYDDLEKLLNPDGRMTALMVDMALPAFDEDSGSLRMFEILDMMGEMGIKISFYPDNLDMKPKYRRALERLEIEVLSQDYGITHALTERQYDMVILSRVNIAHRYINLVRLLNPDARVYYDTVDIHYIRELRQAEIEKNDALKKHAAKTRQMELSNCLLSDVVFTVTEEDRRHLQQEIPSVNCFVLPNIHRKHSAEMTWEKSEGLVFIGNYNHKPNQDAVFYFVDHVFPLIQVKIPEIRLYLIGSYMPDEMRALSEKHDAIEAVGWVEKVEPELAKRRVMISYLRYGAGMKGKIGQAMSIGLPVVSTAIGAEGMGLVDGETVLVGDDPKTFADKVCRAYLDKMVWERISRNGKAFIYSHYGIEAVKAKLENFLTTDLTWNGK